MNCLFVDYSELLSEEKSEMCDIESVDVDQSDLYKTLSQYLKHFHNLLLHPPKVILSLHVSFFISYDIRSNIRI